MKMIRENMNPKTKKTAIILLASLFTVSTCGSIVLAKAEAEPIKRDEFHSQARPQKPAKVEPAPGQPGYENPMGKQGSGAMMSNPNDPTVQWFEDMDTKVCHWRKSPEEAAILSQPLNGEVERVQRWINTAEKVSFRYKMLAQMLHGMHAPEDCPELKQYSELVAEWYTDAAEVYDEMIKPRPAPKTEEELDEGLNGVLNRAKMLKESQKRLLAMDIELREKHHVHQRYEDDPLQKYVKVNGNEKPTNKINFDGPPNH